jgi:RNA polymerase sigma-70 factor, ECF subfamily
VRREIEQVVPLIQRNNPQSLEKALGLLQRTVFSFSMNVCGQRQDAEDTMQEVLFKSVPYLPKFESAKALGVWLYKVAKNHCLMSRRKSKFAPKEALSLDDLMPDRRALEKFSENAKDTPETLLMRREDARRVREAVRKLPPEYRLVLVLHDMEELSDEDIAEIMGLRPGTVRVRLHRARLFVRRELEKREQRGMRRAPANTDVKAGLAPPPRGSRCKQMFAELSDYLDDELDDSLCEKLEEHMEGCEPCKAFLSSLERSIELCRAAPPESPDPDLAARLRRELLSEYQGVMAKVAKGAENQSGGR